jgi:hypothetical protein
MERPLWRGGLQEETAVDVLLIGYKHFSGDCGGTDFLLLVELDH